MITENKNLDLIMKLRDLTASSGLQWSRLRKYCLDNPNNRTLKTWYLSKNKNYESSIEAIVMEDSSFCTKFNQGTVIIFEQSYKNDCWYSLGIQASEDSRIIESTTKNEHQSEFLQLVHYIEQAIDSPDVFINSILAFEC